VFEEHERSLVARVRNFELDILFVRTNDVIEFVGDGVADLGITGEDLLAETGAELPRLRSLGYGQCRLAAAVPADSAYRELGDLSGVRVATAHPNTTRRFFDREGISFKKNAAALRANQTRHRAQASELETLPRQDRS